MGKSRQKKLDKQKNREKLVDWESLYEDFGDESDRGHALLAAAALDLILRDLLASFMIDDEEKVEALLGSETRPDAPLGSFRARITAAYCLGLITKDQLHNLDMIRQIRNHFAHNLHGSTFEDEPVQSWVGAFRNFDSNDWESAESTRQRFGYVFTDLEVDLGGMAEEVRSKRCTVREESYLERARREIRQQLHGQ